MRSERGSQSGNNVNRENQRRSILRERDLQFIREFVSSQRMGEGIPRVDSERVGELIAISAIHRIYAYGDNDVIKVPVGSIGQPAETIEETQQTLDITARYFRPYDRARPLLVSREGSNDYLMLQRRLHNFQNLTPSHLANELLTDVQGNSLRTQFENFITRDRGLYEREQSVFDYFGREGILKSWRGEPQMANLVVEYTDDGAYLTILGTGLNKTGKKWHPKKTRAALQERLISFINYRINRRLMRKNFGYTIGKQDK